MSDDAQLDSYLQFAVDQQASDLYFSTDAPVMLRVGGDIYPVRGATRETLTPDRIEAMALGLMSADQRARFEREHRSARYATARPPRPVCNWPGPDIWHWLPCMPTTPISACSA